MRLDISELARTPGMRATQDIDETCSLAECGIDFVGPVTGRIELTNTGELLLVRGSIGAEVRLLCSRCATDFVTAIHADIAEQFRLVHTVDQVIAVPMEGEEDISEILHGHILDVEELIRQNLLTEMPFQPLCRPDCEGLCPICGQDLSEGECECYRSTAESPFGALADLLEELEEEETDG